MKYQQAVDLQVVAGQGEGSLEDLEGVVVDIGGADGGAAQDQEALHHVAKLADVAGPGALFEEGEGLVREGPYGLAAFAADAGGEMLDQKWDIVLTLVQGRNL